MNKENGPASTLMAVICVLLGAIALPSLFFMQGQQKNVYPLLTPFGGVTDTALHCEKNAQCDDGNICTSDFCDFSHGRAIAKCRYSVNPHVPCDDGNACTVDDVCDTVTRCIGKPFDGGNCDDGNICTLADTCSGSTCTGTSIECYDGNPCTDDYCDHRAGCTFSDMGWTDCETVILKQYGVL